MICGGRLDLPGTGPPRGPHTRHTAQRPQVRALRAAFPARSPKVWAYEGVPQEVIEERIASWQRNVEQLRREGKYPAARPRPR